MVEPVMTENPETMKNPVVKENPVVNENPETMENPVVTKKAVLTCAQVQEKIHKPEKTWSAEQLWLTTCSEVFDQFTPGLTVKKRGQLKQFLLKCPPATGESVLVKVLRNWATFTVLVEKETGAKQSPSRPQIGYLLQNVGAAVTYYLDPVKPKQQPFKLQGLHSPTGVSNPPAGADVCTDPASKPAQAKPPKPKKLDKVETKAAWDDYFPDGKPKGI